MRLSGAFLLRHPPWPHTGIGQVMVGFMCGTQAMLRAAAAATRILGLTWLFEIPAYNSPGRRVAGSPGRRVAGSPGRRVAPPASGRRHERSRLVALAAPSRIAA